MNGHLLKLATVAVLAGALGAASAFGQEFGATASTNLSVTIGPEAAIAITTADTALTTSGGLFAPFTGTTNFLYKIRTTQSTGEGHISLTMTDFSESGGPSVAKGALTYGCSVAASASESCGSNTTASTTSPTPVASFGADAHSTTAGDAGSIAWSLVNDPVYKTGTYTATATLTISVL